MGYLSLLAVIGFGFVTLAQAEEKFDVGTALAAHKKVTTQYFKVDQYVKFMKDEGFKNPDDELIAIFNLMDKNRNGHLDQVEFVNGYLLYLEFRSYDESKDSYLQKGELMKTMDVDNSGKLSFIELFARMNTGYKLDPEWKKTLGTDYFK